MTIAHIHFHDLLHQLLRTRKNTPLVRIEFNGRQTIKHLVESLGIPHTEVGHLQVKDAAVGFGYLVKDGDSVQVYPAAADQDHLSGMFKDGKLTIPTRFILDNHLGKLASDLRMLGFDADYTNQYQDQELADIAVSQGRILLTRDRQLLMRKSICYGYLLRSMDPDEQLLEILERFNLLSEIKLFQRCMHCNHVIESVEKIEIQHRLEPLTRKYFNEFRICPGCQQIYWAGSHVEHIEVRLAKLLPTVFNQP
jgi:uncharacterized protein with PIN domain